MSLYRQAGRVSSRTLGAVAGAALLVGGGAGYAIGSATSGDEEASVADAVAALRTDVRPIRNALDFVPTEYSEGVEDGRVVSEPEYGAARAAVQRARDAYAASRADLRALSVERASVLEEALAALGGAVDQRRHETQIQRLAAGVAAALQAAVG